MPRPNQARSVSFESVLTLRIEQERQSRGWTYDRLAQEMTAVGCAITGSALWKIEKGQPRRRITVNELGALSLVWAIPMDRLCGVEGATGSRRYTEHVHDGFHVFTDAERDTAVVYPPGEPRIPQAVSMSVAAKAFRQSQEGVSGEH